MVLEGIRKLLDRLSVRAVFNRLDRRKLQNELDTHRLFLLTSHHLKVSKGEQQGAKYVQELAAQAAELGHEGMQTAVAAALHQQLVTISRSIHGCLSEAEDPMYAAKHAMSTDLWQQQHAAALASPKTRRPRGLAAAMGAVDSRQSAHLTPWQDPVNSPHQETSQVPTSAKQKADSAQPDLPVPNVERVDKSQATPDDSHQSNDSGSSSSSSSDEDSSSDDGSSSDSNDKRPASALLANSHTAVSDVLGANSASASQQHSRQSRPNSALNLASVSEALKQKLGYTLHVRPSGIAHAEAGQGLWLEGRAPVGAVVALYPGLVYSPIHYRRIPGFPKIDTDNDYFLARFDGALIDGQSWTRVRADAGSMQSVSRPENALHRALLAQLQQKETRHPLAQAHFANHPAAGTQPNVMVAAYDFGLQQGNEAWMTAYMPNVMYQEQTPQDTQETAEQAVQPSATKGIAFVATRELQDEELLLNYRLNPQVHKPDWYSPIDVEEDKRRWY